MNKKNRKVVEKKKIDIEKIRLITELCNECNRDYRFCDVCLDVFGEVI